MTALLEARGLAKHFALADGRTLRAVDGVDLDIAEGETLGLVGESGCGKSTLGRLLLGLERPTAGLAQFGGADMLAARGAARMRMRRDIQIIFQDPYSSFNPRMTVAQIVGEPFAIHGLERGSARRDRIAELLTAVGLSPDQAGRYPHEFSGGQRQRIGIARALALRPRLVVCDEPVSALDVSVQAQVLNLLDRLRREMGLSYLFIAHGLAVVRHISDRIGVMYLGRIVELAPKQALFDAPAHPYTRSLLSAVPVPDPRRRPVRQVLQGDVPSPIDPPSGCRFHPRCPMAAQVGSRCVTEMPQLRRIAPGHFAACHLHDTL